MINNTVTFYMTKNLHYLSENDNIKDSMKAMYKNNISHLLVNNNDNNLVGVISRNDLLDKMRRIANETSCKKYTDLELESTPVSTIMSKNLITLNPNDSVEYAVELFLQKQFHCLPVVKNNKPVGIVTMFDLLKGYYQEYG